MKYYVIGDVHGMLEALQNLLDKINSHSKVGERELIFVGDYIDRGKHSKEVIELIKGLQRDENAICLRGNHEEMCIDAYDATYYSQREMWLINGGVEALESYGPVNHSDLMNDEYYKPMYNDVEWMKTLPYYVERPTFVATHAGMNDEEILAGISLADMNTDNLIWTRYPRGHNSPLYNDKIVVHGHTPAYENPSWTSTEKTRLNVDSLSFKSGIVSAVCIEDGDYRIIK